MPNPETTVGYEYRITLRGGEVRRCLYLGLDPSGRAWWRDTETLYQFSEDSLMHAWQVVEKIAPAAAR